MSKFIRMDLAITDTAAPFAKIVPGVAGFTDRYVADQVPVGAGAIVSQWAASEAGSTLMPTPGGTAPTTLALDGSRKFVRAPGGGGVGRLLGAHKSSAPFTVAAVVRAASASTVGVFGVSGAAVNRNSAGYWQATGGATLNTLNNSAGWIFALLQFNAGTLLLRTADVEATASSTLTPPGTFGGLYFGPSTAEAVADCKELIYWPTALNASERSAVHAYAKAIYPEVA